jgi:hypothetical protein
MKTISECLLIAIVVLTASQRVSAQTTEPFKPVCDILQIDKAIATVSLTLGVDRTVRPTMACLLSLWRNDKGGSTKFTVSNAFLAVMEQNPRTFFSVMANEPAVFSEWLNGIADLTFTWPFDPPCQLEVSRAHLISILQNARVDAGRAENLKATVTAKLSSIRCRQIN